VDEVYVMARKVLLDALDALGDHRSAVTLVGAQAIYLRVGDADVAVAPYTTDGDLSIDPDLLGEEPALEGLMRRAGFERKESERGDLLVGIWAKASQSVVVSVDLLMPDGVASAEGRRAARLKGHETGSVLKVPGIEAALVDADMMTLSALDPDDARSIDVRVAGTGALLVAKLQDPRPGTRREAQSAQG